MSKENKITAYKGFNKDLTCNGFQYEVGKEYEMPEDEVQICQAGFHACESPLEVLDYYFMDDNCDMARFAEVEQSGKISMENDGSTKMASSKIRIKAELKFSDLVKIGIDWLIEKTRPVVGKKGRNNDGGEDSAKIGSSGYSAQIGSSGDSAQIGSSGYSAKINSTGEDSVICCAGHGSRVKAKLGSWITLAEWGWDDAKRRYVPKMVKTIRIDGENYKPDTWYMMKDGEIVEVK
jgi:hypothetical protein